MTPYQELIPDSIELLAEVWGLLELDDEIMKVFNQLRT